MLYHQRSIVLHCSYTADFFKPSTLREYEHLMFLSIHNMHVMRQYTCTSPCIVQVVHQRQRDKVNSTELHNLSKYIITDK